MFVCITDCFGLRLRFNKKLDRDNSLVFIVLSLVSLMADQGHQEVR